MAIIYDSRSHLGIILGIHFGSPTPKVGSSCLYGSFLAELLGGLGQLAFDSYLPSGGQRHSLELDSGHSCCSHSTEVKMDEFFVP